MDLQIVLDSIINSKEQYICHQCNCLTTRSAGTAKEIFDAFPYSDIYKDRPNGYNPHPTDVLGTIVIKGNGIKDRFVINMIAQYYPGITKYPNSTKDGILVRQQAFQSCLDQISKIPGLESVAFPWKIGCNLAGGDWIVYRKMLKNFAESTGIKVRIYKRI